MTHTTINRTYYSGGYNGGWYHPMYGYGLYNPLGSNFWMWMYLFDRPHYQQVYSVQQPAADSIQAAPAMAPVVVDDGYSVWNFIGFVLVVGLVVLCIVVFVP